MGAKAPLLARDQQGGAPARGAQESPSGRLLVQPRRWVVGRFIAWIGNRRLAKDFDATIAFARALLSPLPSHASDRACGLMNSETDPQFNRKSGSQYDSQKTLSRPH